MSKTAQRFVCNKCFDHSDLNLFLHVADNELDALLEKTAEGPLAVFN